MKSKSKLFFFAFFLFCLLGVNFVFIQQSFALTLEINYPRFPGTIPPQDFGSAPPEELLSYYVKYIFDAAIWAGGIIALAALIYGGIKYLLSTGKPDAIISAKDQIFAAFFGLLILFSSVLVLKIINPELVFLGIPKPEVIKIIERPFVSPPPSEEFQSAINTEIPFSKAITLGLFEGRLPWKEEKRIPRIKTNVEETKKIIDKLKKQSEDLREASNDCSCSSARPCCWDSDPGKGCKNNSCSSKQGCTCDPCRGSPRTKIQNLEEKNRTEINNLIVEQIKTEEEIRLLKEQLAKLERVEKFITECSDWLDTLSDFLSKKVNFEENNWPFRKVNLWEKIMNKGDLATADWSTFYCPVSGTILGQLEYTGLTPEEMEEITGQKELIEPFFKEQEPIQPQTCELEAPVGEIIDRAKRMGYRLVNQLEKVVELEKKLIDAIDKLQVLVSQCSSQRCYSYCNCVPCDEFCCSCYPRANCCCWCFKTCRNSVLFPEGPCPKSEINHQLDEIQEIWQKITNLINGKGPKVIIPDNIESVERLELIAKKIENTGILQLISENEIVIPKLFEDLVIVVGETMKSCISETPSDVSDDEAAFEKSVVLSNCLNSVGGVGPDKAMIINCCEPEEELKEFNECLGYLPEEGKKFNECLKYLPEEGKEFTKCLGLCFLEEGNIKYKKCLQPCLDEEAKKIEKSDMEKAEKIRSCRHIFNFYCCGG